MILDFSVLFDRLGEQMSLMLIMLQRKVVQRQLLVMLAILLIAWLLNKALAAALKRLEGKELSPQPAEDQAAAQPSFPALDERGVRWLRAVEFNLFPVLLLLLLYRVLFWFAGNGWPSGLIEAVLPLFWLLLSYRLLVSLVLVTFPKDQSDRLASEVLRPAVWILLLLIARDILFSTLGIDEISLFRFAEWTINLGDLINALIVVLLAFIVSGAVRKLILNVMARNDVEPDVASTVSNVIRYGVIGLGTLIAISTLGIELGALAWIGGGLAVGLGFGLQELVANFISGIVLVFERIVRPGDVIEVGGMRGAVSKVYMRATVLKTPDNAEIIVPNKEMMTKSVLALTYSDRITRVRLDVGVTYDADLDLARRVLLETITSHPLILSDPAPGAMILEMKPYSIDFIGFGYVADFNDWFRVRSELYEMVRDAFARHGVIIPFPRQDIHISVDPQ